MLAQGLVRVLALLSLLGLVLPGAPARAQDVTAQQFPTVQLPPGYQIEKVVDGLTYTTGMTWDDQGRLYVLEAGGQFLEEPPPPRILRIEPGRATEVVNLADKGVADSAVGITWHQGAFYITHRDPDDRSGAVSRVTPDGAVTRLVSGIMDSQSEHQVNDIKVGPDGRMYLASGPAGNMAVMGLDNAPFIQRSPNVHTTPCRDYVLTGQNFQTPDFRTKDDPSDLAVTGAFVPFGTATTPGQRIAGTNKCGGSILVFNPANAEATLRPYAWGFRNVIGIAWNVRGEMVAAVNGIDIRGSHSIRDEFDATYRVREGAWYGWPDFSAALEPVTEPKFDFPESQRAPVVVSGQPQGKPIRFVIDHAASGLTAPDRSLVFGLHEWNSSPSMIDFAPAAWGELAGQLFAAEWGDLAPATNPLRDMPTGHQVSRIDPATGQAVPFVRNVKPGPASAQGAAGMGLERPFDVKFGPDGAMYISDYGVARINPARAAQGQVPYEFPPRTGVIWKVTRTGAPGAPDAGVTVTPTATPGLFDVRAGGFEAGETVTVRLTGPSRQVVMAADTTATAQGAVSFQLRLARHEQPGRWTVTLHGEDSDRELMGAFMVPVRGPDATLTVSQPSGPAGTTFTFTGSGFQPGETVTYWSGPEGMVAVEGSVTATSEGRVTFSYTVPAGARPGRWSLSAYGLASDHLGITYFTVG